jgi:carboxyl-terminal processing protease
MGMRLRHCLWAVLALTLCWTVDAVAGEGKPYVVLIGVQDYKDAAIKKKPHADQDVQALYDLLTAPQNRGLFSPDNIKLLVSAKDEKRPHQLATKANILQALKWACGTATLDDTVIICWVGQGAPTEKAACYFAADSTLAGRAKDAVSNVEIEHEIGKTKSHSLMVLLDVNFRAYGDDPLKISEMSLKRRFSEFAAAPQDDEREEEKDMPRSLMFLSANNGLSESAKTDKHGLFMTVVLEALEGKGDKEGEQADGIVNIDELVTYIDKEYTVRSEKVLGRLDFPQMTGRSSHMTLSVNPPAAEEAAKKLTAFQKVAREGNLGDEMTKEGKQLLSQMPRLGSQRELRKKYQDLADGKMDVAAFLTARQRIMNDTVVARDDADTFAKRVLRVGRYVQEEYVKPVKLSEMTASAIKGLYRTCEEKLPRDIQQRLDKLQGDNEAELQTLLADVRQHLGNRTELKGSKAVDVALNWMLHSLDQHSSYIDPETLDKVRIQLEQEFIGVGIRIEPDYQRELVRISTPILGSPAYKAGIKSGDHLVSITNYVDKEGKELPEPKVHDAKGMTTSTVVDTILGKRGTKVRLTIERQEKDGPKKIDFDLVRNIVSVETVLGVKRNEDDTWDYYLDKQNKIVYIRLTQFAVNTERDLRRVISKHLKDGINGMILDLRFNPGGYLKAAVEISDLFVDDGVIVTVRPRDNGGVQVYRGKHAGSLVNFPVVVLVNQGSASASEIVSACIQDQERGIVMGERSYGKGSVQNVHPMNLGDGLSQLKLTIATFWRPNGKNLNRFPNSKDEDDWGVAPLPEHNIPLTPTEMRDLREHMRDHENIPRRDMPKKADKEYVDKQLNSALDLIRKQVCDKKAAKGQ